MADTSPQLESIDVRNQVMLERLKSGEHKKFAPFLKRIEREVRSLLSDAGDKIGTKKRLNTLLSDVTAAQKAVYDDYNKQLVLDLTGVGEQQAKFEAKSYEATVVAYESTVPAVEQVLTAIRVNPLQVEGLTGKPLLEPFIKDWSSTEIQRVNNVITQGFYQGQTNAQITKNIRGTKANKFNDGTLAKVNRSNSTLVRTAVQHASTQARVETMKQNSDLVKGYEWVSTLDSKTSAICSGLDGRQFKIGEGPLPPAHPNCVLGSTLVSTCSDVSTVFKRRYKGAVVDLVTKSGRHLSITPNHPVLTSRGWVAAGEIDRGDEVAIIGDGHAFGDNHENSVKAKFSYIFSALNVPRNSGFVSNRPVSAEDFHGDGVTNTNVSIVNVDSLAWRYVKAAVNQGAANKALVFGARVIGSLSRICGFNLGRSLDSPAFSCSIRPTSKGFLFKVGAPVHSALLLFRSISKGAIDGLDESSYWPFTARKPYVAGYAFYAYARIVSLKNKLLFYVGKNNNPIVCESDIVRRKDSKYGLLSDTKSLSYFLGRKVVDSVELDDVSYIRTREYNGHVYNLENKENWYTSNGIITHNCRSTTAPVLSEKFDFLKTGATRSSKGADGGAQVSTKETYYSWLKKQPKAFQENAIGVKKSALLRNGGLSADEFAKLSLNRNFEPLTLDEMYQKMPSVFESAGVKP